MSFVAAVALSVAVLAPQEEAPSLADELAALVERTNRIETLHLVYEAESEKDGEAKAVVVELAYRAPDLMRLHITRPEGEVEHWILGARMYLLSEGRWQKAEIGSLPAALDLLE